MGARPAPRRRRRGRPGRGRGERPTARRSRPLPPASCPPGRGAARRHLGIAPARHERRNPPDGVGVAPMAGRDAQLGVGTHEGCRHDHGIPVGEHEGDAEVAELLDDADQVVPAPGVEPGSPLPQLEEDLVHLEGGRDRLDEDGRPYVTAGEAERVLAAPQHVVPQPGLEMALELGQVEVGSGAHLDQCGARGGGVEGGSKSAAATGSSSTSTCRSTRCHPRGADDDLGELVAQAVGPALRRRQLERARGRGPSGVARITWPTKAALRSTVCQP